LEISTIFPPRNERVVQSSMERKNIFHNIEEIFPPIYCQRNTMKYNTEENEIKVHIHFYVNMKTHA
jgi:hypothetical protein